MSCNGNGDKCKKYKNSFFQFCLSSKEWRKKRENKFGPVSAIFGPAVLFRPFSVHFYIRFKANQALKSGSEG